MQEPDNSSKNHRSLIERKIANASGAGAKLHPAQLV
ncbi:hypothetical protein YSA_08303 [Pseudomonas putida ND6]|uniref:Uncharacterized protein n=1 Tax=Pseudomonas putida ND6 TaxID=231023 RepID=I3V0I7_PSEPU|nr:hypothetical protein YSA_08303 [Pseudomonas putida ND6]